MADREPPGYDDWFDDPEPPTLEGGRGGRSSYDIPAETEEDVWVLPEDEQRRRRRSAGRGDVVIGGRSLTTTQLGIIAAAVLAIFIAILAAFNVFSGNPAATSLTHDTTQSTLPTTGATTATIPTLKLPTKTPLKQGDSGPQVRLLQKALAAAGFSPGKADGVFGSGTTTAVEDLQSANALTVDGVVGADTLAALRQALGR